MNTDARNAYEYPVPEPRVARRESPPLGDGAPTCFTPAGAESAAYLAGGEP